MVRRVDLYSLAREATLIAHALGRKVRVDVESALDSSELVLCAREGTALDLDQVVEGVVWSGENLVAFTDTRIHAMRTLYRNRLIAGGLDDIGYVHAISRRAACLSAHLSSLLSAHLSLSLSLALSHSLTHSLANSLSLSICLSVYLSICRRYGEANDANSNPFALDRPVETLIGTAQLWLNALELLVDVDESLAIVGHRGDDRGSLAVSIHIDVLDQETGVPKEMDPELVASGLKALLGNEININLCLHSCTGLPTELALGVFVRARFFPLGPKGGHTVETTPLEGGANIHPRFEHRALVKLRVTQVCPFALLAVSPSSRIFDTSTLTYHPAPRLSFSFPSLLTSCALSRQRTAPDRVPAERSAGVQYRWECRGAQGVAHRGARSAARKRG